MRLDSFLEINPHVILEKDKKYTRLMLDDITPGYRYVTSKSKEVFKGGGAKFINGDTLFARITPSLENGKIAQFKGRKENEVGFGSTEFIVLRGKENTSDSDFIFYLSLTETIRKPAEKSMFGASGRQRVDISVFKQIEIQPPNLETQRKIASILSAYDDLIENNTRRIQILEEMAQAIYRKWFVHFRYPGYEDVKLVESELGLIPEGWKVKKLGKVANLRWGDTNTTKKKYVKEGYPAFSASGLDGKLSYFDFDCDGVVLSAIGANCGRTWFTKNKWSCIKNTIRFWSIDKCVSTEFLFYSSNDTNFWPKRGSAQPFISQTDARNIKIIVPTEEINNLFTNFVMKTMGLSDVLFRKNIILQKTRDLLLPRLITGELDVSNLIIGNL